MFVLSTPNHTHLDMVNCLSLEKATKKNEKLFALKQLFWFFKNILVPDGFGRQPSYCGMLVFGYHSHTHHNPFGLLCPISPSKTCWVTLYKVENCHVVFTFKKIKIWISFLLFWESARKSGALLIDERERERRS